MTRTLNAILVFTFFVFPISTVAQEEARAAWQITNFDISVNLQQAERTLAGVANLAAVNVGRGTGTSFTFRINNKAVIKTVTVGNALATFRAVPESSGNLQRVTATLPSSAASGATMTVNVNYTLPVESNTGLSAISPIGSQFLPLSFWYPSPNTPFSIRGADTAPFRLTVNATNVVSSGIEKSSSPTTIYEQSLNGQPFFVQGEWDRVDGTGDARSIIALMPRGAAAEEKKQAESLISIAGAARTFYSGLLGPAPDVPIRLVGVRRGSGFSDGGTVLIDTAAFRRSKPDAITVVAIAEAVARLWIGGQTAIRGEGGGVLRDGLVRYLAALFIEKQFGRDAAREELLRERLAYSTVARRDAPIARLTALEPTYFSSVPNKGAMVWRLVENNLTRDGLMQTLRTVLQSSKTSGVTLAAVRTALTERGGESLKTLLDQQLDQVTDLDLMIGVPQQRGTDWVSALRNLGSIDAITTARATTATGEQVSVPVTVGARNFGEAVFKTNARVVRVEIDPEKLYPQLDYANDTAPKARDIAEGLSEASRQFGAQDYAKAESIARELLNIAPNLQEARIVLGRALLGLNRVDEAEKVFQTALSDAFPTPATLAWASIGLGEISLKKSQAAEAARHFNAAVRADAEYAASLAARAGRIKAETATNSLKVDPEVRTFVGQLDQTITSGKKADLETRIVSGELVRFIGGIVGTQPEVWQTRVLRTEQLETNLVAADVSLDTKELGRQQTGTAVLILARVGGAWRLAGIDLFEVR